MKKLFPLVGVCIHTKKSFIIHVIDFENQTVFNRIAQNGDGNSYDFSEIYIMEGINEGIVNMLMNSGVNYDNFDLINGSETIYDNEYHELVDEERKNKICLRLDREEKQREINSHNNEIEEKIEALRKEKL